MCGGSPNYLKWIYLEVIIATVPLPSLVTIRNGHTELFVTASSIDSILFLHRNYEYGSTHNSWVPSSIEEVSRESSYCRVVHDEMLVQDRDTRFGLARV